PDHLVEARLDHSEPATSRAPTRSLRAPILLPRARGGRAEPPSPLVAESAPGPTPRARGSAAPGRRARPPGPAPPQGFPSSPAPPPRSAAAPAAWYASPASS